MNVRQYRTDDHAEWLRMRLLLWPESSAESHESEMVAWLKRPDTVVLVVPRTSGGLAGFAEVGMRSIADGCETSPVAYLEGWFVDEDVRRQGFGAALVHAAEFWARERGSREFASDTQLGNVESQRAHAALGFREVDRVVAYIKAL